MAVIGNLAVSVSANTIGLTKGLGGAAGVVTGFGKRLGGLAAKILPVGAAIGGLAATIKGFLSVKEQFGEIDDIAKFSAQTGIATEELVGLQHAANLSGVSFQDLRRAQQRMIREGHDIAGLADQMAALEDPTEKAQLAYEAMGRSGQELIPLLQFGGDAIRQMVNEGKELAGFSAVDAAKVEAANDSIARMKLSFTGVARDLAITLAPAVDWVGQKTLVVGKWMRGAFEDIRPIVVQTGNVVLSVWESVASVGSAVFSSIRSFAGNTFGSVKDFIIDALIVGEFLFQNLGDIADLTWTKIALGAVGFWNDFEHIFTAQIPAVLSWFGDNWTDIIFTAVDYSLTTLINFGQNVRNLWTGILDFIAGRGFNVDWTPLTEGAVSTLKSLPEIPEREMSALERQLQMDVDRMSGDLTGRLAEHMQLRRQELLGPGETFDLEVTGIGDLEDLVDGASKAASIDFGLSQAQQQAIQLQALGAGAGRKPEEQTAKNTERMLAELRDQTRTLSQLLNQQRRAPQPQTATI